MDGPSPEFEGHRPPSVVWRDHEQRGSEVGAISLPVVSLWPSKVTPKGHHFFLVVEQQRLEHYSHLDSVYSGTIGRDPDLRRERGYWFVCDRLTLAAASTRRAGGGPSSFIPNGSPSSEPFPNELLI